MVTVPVALAPLTAPVKSHPISWPLTGVREVGIPTYGVQGFFYGRDDIRFHGQDERLPVVSFYSGQEFMWDLVHILLTAQN